VDGDIEKIMALVRQAAELGADIIKADPCSDIMQYHRVVEVAGDVPILVRGGGKAPDAEIIERTTRPFSARSNSPIRVTAFRSRFIPSGSRRANPTPGLFEYSG
jgi:hypothetical protein